MEMPQIILSIGLVLLMAVHNGLGEPAGCPHLRTVIPQCSCESAVENPNDIVINCRSSHPPLTSMPLINGTYGGTIYEFTVAKNDIQDLPDDAFGSLRIQRIDVTENKLNNISQFAFRGQETFLTVLKIGGDSTSLMTAPFTALASLTNLQELEMYQFVLPGNTNNLENRAFFQPFSNLLKLTLDNMSLASIGQEAFIGLTSLKEITLSIHPQLVSYPVAAINNMKATLEKITITHTGVTALHFYAFEQMQVLTKLVFSYNNINVLEDSCFKGLETKLTHLDLSYNGIPINQLNRVGELHGLEVLQLQNIGLVSLDERQFLQNKTNLLELNLARNFLETIPNNAFQALPKLTKLELSQNRITEMKDQAFSGLTSLQSLYLDSQTSQNVYLILPSMSELSSLTLLSLENTIVSTQSWANISQAQSLVTLKMRNTRMSAITPLTFTMMTSLNELDLSDNHIMEINQETFVGPRRSLKKLYLFNNKIQTFDACTFSNYSLDLKVDLFGNPLRCDCSLHWLITAVKESRILFDNDLVTCFYPSSMNGSQFTSHEPSDFCLDPPDLPTCGNYYTTTTTPPPTTTTQPSIQVNVVPVSTTINTVGISWTLDRTDGVSHVKVVHKEIPDGQDILSRDIPTSTTSYTITDLKSNTRYQICVEAHRTDNSVNDQCISEMTKPSATDLQSTTVDPQAGNQMSNNTEVGIIIGAVIGGLLLFGILVAIIYLMFIRKRSQKDKIPVQPRNFTRSEIPTMAYDSKRYIKKKKDTTDGNKNDVNVTVISDGKTGPNIGRISAGSYQYLQDKQPPYVNDSAAKQSSSTYENDVNGRPLPQMPRDSAGYYNPSFRNSTADTKPHEYSEIKL